MSGTTLQNTDVATQGSRWTQITFLIFSLYSRSVHFLQPKMAEEHNVQNFVFFLSFYYLKICSGQPGITTLTTPGVILFLWETIAVLA